MKVMIMNHTLIDIYKDMLLNPNFEQNKCSITSTGIYRIAHDGIRLMKWICYYNRSFYESNIYYDLMGSICNHLKEISQR